MYLGKYLVLQLVQKCVKLLEIAKWRNSLIKHNYTDRCTAHSRLLFPGLPGRFHLYDTLLIDVTLTNWLSIYGFNFFRVYKKLFNEKWSLLCFDAKGYISLKLYSQSYVGDYLP